MFMPILFIISKRVNNLDWDFIVVLIDVDLVTCLLAIYVFFGEVAIQILSPFLK